jgi:transcriptional regulator with XRE-family HTH domain
MRDTAFRKSSDETQRVPPSPNPSVQRRRLAFGSVVRAKRKSLGLSQEKLAERAGCDRQSINRVENAAYSPSLDRVFKLADALGMSLSDLFDEFDRVDSPAAASNGSDRRDNQRSGQPPGERAAAS